MNSKTIKDEAESIFERLLHVSTKDKSFNHDGDVKMRARSLEATGRILSAMIIAEAIEGLSATINQTVS